MSGLRAVSCRNAKAPLNTRICVGQRTVIRTQFRQNPAHLRAIEIVSSSAPSMNKAKSLLMNTAAVEELRLYFDSAKNGKDFTIVVKGDPNTIQFFGSMYYYLALSVKPNSAYSFNKCLGQIMYEIDPPITAFARANGGLPPILYLHYANSMITASTTSESP